MTMDSRDDSNVEILKNEIFEKVKQYYKLFHEKNDSSQGSDMKINYAGRIFNEDELVSLIDSSLEFWLTYGRYSRQFEQKFSNMLGIKYCNIVNSGSSANLLAFMALTSPLLGPRQVKKGDEFITVAAAFPTTVAPILQYGAIPVFIDVELETCNINIDILNKSLSKKTKGVILAHTLGNPFNLEYITNFCTKNGLWLIEDNCDALGSKYFGKYTGTFGDIATSSFYPPHHITMGEGGAVYTNNKLLHQIVLSLRDWGRDCWCDSGRDNTCNKRFNSQFGTLPFGFDHKYVYSHFGYNLKVTDMQASIGCAQLDKLDMFIQKRRSNFQYLFDNLKKYDDLFILPQPTKNSEPSWFGFLLTIRDGAPFSRNEIVEFLESQNIQTRNLFSGNILRHPCFQGLYNDIDYKVIDDLRNTDIIMNNSFWIGVYPGLTKIMLDYMIEKIELFIGNYKLK